jgi:hypothetical protein
MNKGKLIYIILIGIALSACSFPTPGNEGGTEGTFEPSATIPIVTGEIAVPTVEAIQTTTPVSTNTPSPSRTPIESEAPIATKTVRSEVDRIENQPEQLPPYVIQPGSPVVASNFVSPDKGCNFLGVGGQVFDLDGEAVKGLVVDAHGSLNGENVLGLSLTGSAPNLGPGGFVIQLADQPTESENTIAIQLHDLEGHPLSEEVAFPTYSDCSKNFVLINFVEITTDQFLNKMILPIIER